MKISVILCKELPELYQAFRSYFVGPIAEIAPVYRAARCVFAPMVSGTGISIKTIEALALGKPFVGTSKAYRGMPMDLIEQAGLQAHDTPQDFADAIVRALSAEQLAAAASHAAYVTTAPTGLAVAVLRNRPPMPMSRTGETCALPPQFQ